MYTMSTIILRAYRYMYTGHGPSMGKSPCPCPFTGLSIVTNHHHLMLPVINTVYTHILAERKTQNINAEIMGSAYTRIKIITFIKITL